MSESEQREIIEFAASHFGSVPDMEMAYIAGATAMAEKKNVEISRHKQAYQEMDEVNTKVITDLKAQLEAAQEELKTAYKAANEWKSEYHKVVDSEQALEAELSRVKEIAKQFAIALEYPNLTTQSATAQTLTEFANLMNKER